jgi:hypothetical protein
VLVYAERHVVLLRCLDGFGRRLFRDGVDFLLRRGFGRWDGCARVCGLHDGGFLRFFLLVLCNFTLAVALELAAGLLGFAFRHGVVGVCWFPQYLAAERSPGLLDGSRITSALSYDFNALPRR